MSAGIKNKTPPYENSETVVEKTTLGEIVRCDTADTVEVNMHAENTLSTNTRLYSLQRSKMEPEPEPGQITASIGRLCLRFKDPTEANRAQAFVKCTFVGLGASLFSLRPTPEAGEFAPAAPLLQAAGAPVLEKAKALSSWSIESKPVDIIFPIVEEGAITNDSRTGDKARDEQTSVKGGGAAAVKAGVAAGVTIVDMGLRFQSKKFTLNEENLSKLGATQIKMEVCMRGDGGADNSAAVAGVTVIGNATARVVNVLQGRNEWSHTLALGEFGNPAEETAKRRTGGTAVIRDGWGKGEEGEGEATRVWRHMYSTYDLNHNLKGVRVAFLRSSSTVPASTYQKYFELRKVHLFRLTNAEL